MNHIIGINEFVSIKDYKHWVDAFNWKFYKKVEPLFTAQSDKDKKANRIYFDLEMKDDQNYDQVLPKDVKTFLSWFQYPIEDPRLGLCIDKDGRVIKIGKLLKKLGKDDLLSSYEKSRSTTLKKIDNLRVVISRHPYDIIGMSTNRGWTSCLSLNDDIWGGRYLSSLEGSLRNGCLIAYLIRRGDENIRNPISRILIRNHGRLYPDNECYGTPVKEFSEFVGNWCESNEHNW